MTLRLRADLEQPSALSSTRFEWVDSPLSGVQRVMLDRIGDEVAIATSIVRYAPDSRFDPHVHGGGEEFLVLEGVFSDEHGDYPAGTYVRNPPGTAHTPFSQSGCVLFVKLWQFDESDDVQLNVAWREPPQRLFERGAEVVEVKVLEAGAPLSLPVLDVVQEIVVLERELSVSGCAYGPWSWLRWPAHAEAELAADERCVVFYKTRPVYRDEIAPDTERAG